MFDDQLVEKDYDDVIDKKYSINAEKGFLGITDKYWLTSLIPEKNKNFRADFEYSEKFKISYIETEALEAQPNKAPLASHGDPQKAPPVGNKINEPGEPLSGALPKAQESSVSITSMF